MADIVLYDRTGQAVTYNGVETITTDTTADGEKATFTSGVLTDNPVVDLDLSAGNQEVEVESGLLIKGATINKPETLTSENIKSGVSIAGVEGTYEGSKTVAVQSDYNQPDYTANDYIKNRPFYDNDLLYKNEALSFLKQASTVSGLYNRIGFVDYTILDATKTYKLVSNEVVYEDKTAENYTASDGVTYQIFGNTHAFKASKGDTETPYAHGSTFVSVTSADPEETGIQGLSYIIQWFDTEDASADGTAPVEFYCTSVKKIDSKFIPTESLEINWDNISDKPFYAATILTYDGNREGKECIFQQEDYVWSGLVKVSDDVLVLEIGSKFTVVEDGEEIIAEITEKESIDIDNEIMIAYEQHICTLSSDIYIDNSGNYTTADTGTLFGTKGTYFMQVDETSGETTHTSYVSSASENAKQLSPEVIPKLSVGKLEEQPFVYTENIPVTITFDGVLEHALDYYANGGVNSYMVRISDFSGMPTVGDKVVVMDVANNEEVETTISIVEHADYMVGFFTERYEGSFFALVFPEDITSEGVTYKKGVWLSGEVDSDGNFTDKYLKSWKTTGNGYVLSPSFLPAASSEGTVILEAVDGNWQAVPFEQSAIKTYIDNLINGSTQETTE